MQLFLSHNTVLLRNWNRDEGYTSSFFVSSRMHALCTRASLPAQNQMSLTLREAEAEVSSTHPFRMPLSRSFSKMGSVKNLRWPSHMKAGLSKPLLVLAGFQCVLCSDSIKAHIPWNSVLRGERQVPIRCHSNKLREIQQLRLCMPSSRETRRAVLDTTICLELKSGCGKRVGSWDDTLEAWEWVLLDLRKLRSNSLYRGVGCTASVLFEILDKDSAFRRCLFPGIRFTHCLYY